MLSASKRAKKALRIGGAAVKYQVWIARLVLITIMAGVLWAAWSWLPAIYRIGTPTPWVLLVILGFGMLAFFTTALQLFAATFAQDITVIKRGSLRYRWSGFLFFDNDKARGEYLVTTRICPTFLQESLMRWIILVATTVVGGILIGTILALWQFLRNPPPIAVDAPVVIYFVVSFATGFVLLAGLFFLGKRLAKTWSGLATSAFMTIVGVATMGIHLGLVVYLDPTAASQLASSLAESILVTIAVFGGVAAIGWLCVGLYALVTRLAPAVGQTFVAKMLLAAYHKVCLPMKVKFVD